MKCNVIYVISNANDENKQNTENIEEEIKQLKNKVASLKKHYITPPQHVLVVRRQILQAPPSKLSPQKKSTTVTITKWKQKICK